MTNGLFSPQDAQGAPGQGEHLLFAGINPHRGDKTAPGLYPFDQSPPMRHRRSRRWHPRCPPAPWPGRRFPWRSGRPWPWRPAGPYYRPRQCGGHLDGRIGSQVERQSPMPDQFFPDLLLGDTPLKAKLHDINKATLVDVESGLMTRMR